MRLLWDGFRREDVELYVWSEVTRGRSNSMKQSCLQAYFFDPPRGPLAKNVAWKYGMLMLFLGLLAFQIGLFASIPSGYPYERYAGFVTVLILLLNHLSALFYFGPRFTFPFRLFSAAFLAFGSAYILWTLFVAINR